MRISILSALALLLLWTIVWPAEQVDKPGVALLHPQRTARTITVGDDKADVRGFSSAAIQTAIDALRIHNGGTIRLTAGTFTVTAPVRLYDHMALVGSGPETILKKCDGVSSPFTVDADYYELKVTVADPEKWSVGMGVQIYDTPQARDCWGVTTSVITAINGNVLYIQDPLVRDYRSDKGGVIENACSIIAAVAAKNVCISNLVVDGNKSKNAAVNGCVGGAVYMHTTRKAVVENVTVKEWNGDGISWQITDSVTVQNCEVYGCTNTGLHPGTGSPHTVITGNNSHDNGADGIYVCWRVQEGVIADNQLHHNAGHGICTGHKDTDLLFENNHIFNNGRDGINLRRESPANAPHRSVFRNNLVENNGAGQKGYGFAFLSAAADVKLENNVIRCTDQGGQQAGIFIGKAALPIEMKNNKISGHRLGEIVYEKDSK